MEALAIADLKLPEDYKGRIENVKFYYKAGLIQMGDDRKIKLIKDVCTKEKVSLFYSKYALHTDRKRPTFESLLTKHEYTCTVASLADYNTYDSREMPKRIIDVLLAIPKKKNLYIADDIELQNKTLKDPWLLYRIPMESRAWYSGYFILVAQWGEKDKEKELVKVL